MPTRLPTLRRHSPGQPRADLVCTPRRDLEALDHGYVASGQCTNPRDQPSVVAGGLGCPGTGVSRDPSRPAARSPAVAPAGVDAGLRPLAATAQGAETGVRSRWQPAGPLIYGRDSDGNGDGPAIQSFLGEPMVLQPQQGPSVRTGGGLRHDPGGDRLLRHCRCRPEGGIVRRLLPLRHVCHCRRSDGHDHVATGPPLY